MKRLPGALNLLGCSLAILYLWVIYGWITTNDFRVYYDAARALSQGTSPYAVVSYVYSPLFALLLAPLARLSIDDARTVWYLIQIVTVIGFTGVAIAISGSTLARRYWGLVLFLVLISTPTYWDLVLGQVGIVMAFLIVGSYALSRRHPPLAGFLLALAAVIKVYPALVWFFYVFARRRAAVWTVVAGAALLLLTIAVCGVEMHVAFLRTLVGGAAYPLTAEHNNSLVSYWLRIFTVNPFVPPLFHAPFAAYALIGLSIAAVVAACVRNGIAPADRLGQDIQFAIWLCALMLIAPANGVYNLMLLLAPTLILIGYLEQHRARQLLRGLMIGVTIVYLPLATSVFPIPQIQAQRWISPVFTPPIYALVLYFVLMIALAQRRGRLYGGVRSSEPLPA